MSLDIQPKITHNNISIFATLAAKRGIHENMNLIVFYIIKTAKHTKHTFRDKFSHLYTRDVPSVNFWI